MAPKCIEDFKVHERLGASPRATAVAVGTSDDIPPSKRRSPPANPCATSKLRKREESPGDFK